ncbi:MAG: DNA polymerase III [Spirochaetaceae bacterium]|jgi:DNA polymerase-3 subunit gamma/tau|nr:DNA polymerase III [Spirochaetaceae bacterium]
MFENILHQGAVRDIEVSLKKGDLPRGLLFSGERASAKLTAALELARVLSCDPKDQGQPRGRWDCECPSCARHRQLVSQDLLLAGERPCLPEIAAARASLLGARETGAPYTQALRFLFLRGVRKLTARFTPVLWGDHRDAAKISSLTSDIEERLEELSLRRDLPAPEKLTTLTAKVEESCRKLEGEFLYTALPVSHVRAISSWARITTGGKKKTVIIEGAEKIQEGARNALLKILEEPPEGVQFILTTANRQALMPTILSRVRTYRFDSRTEKEQGEVLQRIFHIQGDFPSITAYLDTFLPVNPAAVTALGRDFAERLLAGERPDTKALCREANNFDPPALVPAFFSGITGALKGRLTSARGFQAQREAEFAAQAIRRLSDAQTRMGPYNQNPALALDLLARDILAALK